MRVFHLKSVFTNAEPGNTQHSVKLSGGGAAGGSFVIWKFKGENKHDNKAVFILNWNHVDHTVKTHSCNDTETQRQAVIPPETCRWRQNADSEPDSKTLKLFLQIKVKRVAIKRKKSCDKNMLW